MIVNIDDDFDLYKIVYSGQCFRPVLEGEYYRFITGEHLLYAKELPCTDDSKVTRLEVSCTEVEWEKVWRNYFDLDTSYRNIRDSIPEDDTFLKESASVGAGIRILSQDPFEMLISFIISQRKSIPAIKSSVEKLSSLYGNKLLAKNMDGSKCENVYSFPTPEALSCASVDDLKACGLGYRVEYVLNAAKKVASNELDLEGLKTLSDQELFEELKKLYGVGDKVANCISLFGYHRVDRAPIDTWIKKIIDSKYDGVSPFERYLSNAGIMQQYMFYAVQHLHFEL